VAMGTSPLRDYVAMGTSPLRDYVAMGTSPLLDDVAMGTSPLRDFMAMGTSPLRVVVKPNSAGSSVGVHLVNVGNVSAPQNVGNVEMKYAVTDAFKYDDVVLIQEFIAGREMTVSILGEQVLPVIEIKALEGFYDYTNKYTKGKTEYICPAKINNAETEKIQQYALQIYKAMGCSGYGRVDFMYDEKDFYFLEVNTLPGMTELSLVPMAAKAVDISFEELVRRIISK